MNIRTYLMIKSAASTSEDVHNAAMRALENSDRAADYKNQLDALQGNYDKANAEIDRLQGLVDNGDAERLRLIRENSDLQSQYDDFYGKTKAYEDQVKREADNYRKEILGLKGQAIDYKNQIGGLEGQVSDLNRDYGILQKIHSKNVDDLAAMRNDNSALKKDNANLVHDMNFNADNVMTNYNIGNQLADRGKKLTTYGGATIGGLAGAGLGYAGSNWASKKLGLQGPNVSKKRRIADIALRTLGTAGGGALGAYGGYQLGQYAGDKLFDTSGLRGDVWRRG